MRKALSSQGEPNIIQTVRSAGYLLDIASILSSDGDELFIASSPG
ncbi:hypothetical protein IVA79_07680 [Bradyrhizobium sp. 138]|nr:hypothetical protein [Bradyrhizobium sp. 138]